MKAIDFHNKIDERSDVVENGENCINFALTLSDDEHEELYKRSTSKDNFNYLLNETNVTFEVTANIYLDEHGEVDKDSVNVILVVQDDENGWKDYDVPLTETEKESVLEDMNRFAHEHDTLLKELVKQYCGVEEMKEIDFRNSVDDRADIIENDGQFNFVLQIGYDKIEELFNRTPDEADFKYLADETNTTFEATVNINGDKDVTLLLMVQDDENGWRDYEVALTDNEQDTLRNEIEITVEKQGTSLEELMNEEEVEEEIELD